MKKKNKPKTNLELIKSVRGNWGGINPVTRIAKDKTKYSRKSKYKKDFSVD